MLCTNGSEHGREKLLRGKKSCRGFLICAFLANFIFFADSNHIFRIRIFHERKRISERENDDEERKRNQHDTKQIAFFADEHFPLRLPLKKKLFPGELRFAHVRREQSPVNNSDIGENSFPPERQPHILGTRRRRIIRMNFLKFPGDVAAPFPTEKETQRQTDRIQIVIVLFHENFFHKTPFLLFLLF